MKVKRIKYLLLITVLFLALGVPVALAEEPTEPILIPPSSPNQVTVSGIQETRATVSWSPVSTATQYTIWINGQRWGGSAYPAAEIYGLEAYTDYTVYVTAANDAGESGYSPTTTFKTFPPIPTTPEQPLVIDVTDAQAIIEWQPLPNWQYIQGYRIYVDGMAVADVDHQDGIQSAELINLEPGIHSVAISGLNENREGPVSRPVQFTIQSIPAPTGMVIANRSHDRFLLTWDNINDAERYRVVVNGEMIGETKNNSYFLDGLNSDTQYQVSITAVMNDGNESAPASMNVQTNPAATGLTLETVMASTYEYIPDVLPGMIIVFAIGGAIKIARSGKISIGRRFVLRRF